VTQELQFPSEVGQLEDEQVLARWMAGRTQSSRRLVGGYLYLTSQRLVFTPRVSDAVLDGAYWRAYHADIVDLGRLRKDLSQILGGSLRDRLWIEYNDGAVERFRVQRLDDVIEQIRTVAKIF
jgi:hypothetical protein